MKGFTRDHKFVPMTDYKQVTRKSRDPEAKSEGVIIERKARDPNDVFKRRHLAKVIPKLNNEQIAWIYDKVRFLELNDLKTYKEADDLEENFWKPTARRKRDFDPHDPDFCTWCGKMTGTKDLGMTQECKVCGHAKDIGGVLQ